MLAVAAPADSGGNRFSRKAEADGAAEAFRGGLAYIFPAGQFERGVGEVILARSSRKSFLKSVVGVRYPYTNQLLGTTDLRGIFAIGA